MAAVKEMAIELEIRQDDAAALRDPAAAFRLGMLQACRMINEASGRWVQQEHDTLEARLGATRALREAWRDIYDGVCHLGQTSAE